MFSFELGQFETNLLRAYHDCSRRCFFTKIVKSVKFKAEVISQFLRFEDNTKLFSESNKFNHVGNFIRFRTLLRNWIFKIQKIYFSSGKP